MTTTRSLLFAAACQLVFGGAAMAGQATGASETRAAAGALEADCRRLATTVLPQTRIVSAQVIAAGAYQPAATNVPPNPTPQQQAAAADRTALFRSLPAFCQVRADIATSPASSVAVETWLPLAGWNRQFLATGYSFYGGNMDPVLLAEAIKGGYATATTDGGGAGVRGASFLLNQPEKLKDVGDRAIHEMTVHAKALARTFYGSAPESSWFEGCGGEGRQGLAAAQRHPEDFDGIAVGGLAHDTTHFAFAQVWAWQAAHETPESYIPPAKLPALNEAALNACDRLDGAADRLIGNPERCSFDPQVLACRGAETDQCLTPGQVSAARKIYSPVVNPRTGERIFGPLMPGSERSWTGAVTGQLPSSYAIDFFKYLVFKDPEWDVLKRPLNYDGDLALARTVDSTFNPVDPDLSRYVARGGKLLIYGGWNDVAIPPGANTDYYRSVVERMGAARVQDAVKLVMVPGMGHCPGGFGPPVYDFNPLALLKDWKERGISPDPLVARVLDRGEQVREVLACAWPQVPMYRGSGDVKLAASFECRVQEAGR
jgi:feruloyl esterase